VWAWVATGVDNPLGPAFRGRCAECPVDLPIRQVPANRVTAEVMAAALDKHHPHGPIVEAAIYAHVDLARHLAHRHGIYVPEKPHPSRLRFLIGRPD
jgi:hypothetical protein